MRKFYTLKSHFDEFRRDTSAQGPSSRHLHRTKSFQYMMRWARQHRLDSIIETIVGVNTPSAVFTQPNPSLKYFVKYQARPWCECRWVAPADLANSQDKLDAFTKLSLDGLEPFPGIDGLYKPRNLQILPSFFKPEAVIFANPKAEEFKFLVKWCDLPLSQSTWENDAPRDLVDAYESSIALVTPRTGQTTDPFQHASQFLPLDESPVYRDGSRLSSRALDACEWMLRNWRHQHSSFVAIRNEDVRRTAVIGFLAEIRRITAYLGPFLIVVPLSEAAIWCESITKMTDMRVLWLSGEQTEREWIRDAMIFSDVECDHLKIDVLVVSTIMDCDWDVLSRIGWLALFLDEKCDDKTHGILMKRIRSTLSAGYVTLLGSGPPESMNGMALFRCMSFLDDRVFSSEADFRAKYMVGETLDLKRFRDECHEYIYCDGDSTSALDESKREIVVCEQSSLQQSMISGLIMSSSNLLTLGLGFREIARKIRRICNHPSLVTNDSVTASIAQSSGKLHFLHQLVRYSAEQGRTTLVLTKIPKTIDLLEEFLLVCDFQVLRTDGAGKQQPTGPVSVYLAEGDIVPEIPRTDYVVLFDALSDLGIESKRTTFLLVTRGTVEEDLLSLSLSNIPLSEKNLDLALRNGAQFALFEQPDPRFFRENVGTILATRNQFVPKETLAKDSSDFWERLFASCRKSLPKPINFHPESVETAFKSLREKGYFAVSRAMNHDSLTLLLQVLLVSAYRHVDSKTQEIVYPYICLVLNDDLANSDITTLAQQFPFTDEEFLTSLFGNEYAAFLQRVMTLDRVYRVMSWLSSEDCNCFKFGLSSQMPLFWTECHDYCLLYSYHIHHEEASALWAKFDTLVNEMHLLLPCPIEPHLVSARIKLLIAEIEVSMPLTYRASRTPLSPIDWISAYNPPASAHLESRWLIRKVVYCMFAFGVYRRTEARMAECIADLQCLGKIPLITLKGIIHSVLNRCRSTRPSPFLPNPTDTEFECDVSWIPASVISQLSMLLELHALGQQLLGSATTGSLMAITPWEQAKSATWSVVSDMNMLRVFSKLGLAAVNPIFQADMRALKLDRKMLENREFWELGGKVLSQVHSTFSFLENFESRIQRIMEIISLLVHQNTAVKTLHPARDTGLHLAQPGLMNQNGVPLGYAARRFYRRPEDREKFVEFLCMILPDRNKVPSFQIKPVGTNVVLSGQTVGYVYRRFLEWAMDNGTPLPPGEVIQDGYDFFGLRSPFVQGIIRAAAVAH